MDKESEILKTLQGIQAALEYIANTLVYIFLGVLCITINGCFNK